MQPLDPLLDELAALLRATYDLWSPGWVIFNWRGYTYDHVRRVQSLAATLAQREGGDATVMELAALLHDITKPYDGEYLLDDQGQRLTDERGLWRNAVRYPEGENEVTRLFERLHLAGELHSLSGAAVADHLLRKRGVSADLRHRVATTIAEHLGPDSSAGIESRCLYDADTIDANIGLPAFVRNIYIHAHFYDQRRAEGTPDFDEMLERAPLDYLRPYISENLMRWNDGKQRDFVPRLLTPTARELATERLNGLRQCFVEMAQELDDYETCSTRGALAVVLHFMRHRDDPSIAGEVASLANGWLAATQPTPAARDLLVRLQAEMAGQA